MRALSIRVALALTLLLALACTVTPGPPTAGQPAARQPAAGQPAARQSAATQPAAAQPAAAPPAARPWTRSLETFPVYSRQVVADTLRSEPLDETVFLRAAVARITAAGPGLSAVSVAVNGHALVLGDGPEVALDLTGLVRWGPNWIRIAARPAAAPGAGAPGGGWVRLAIEIPRYLRATFAHTNDIHGALEGLPEQAAEIRRMRERQPNTYFLVAGDIFSGNPVSDLNAGRPVIEALNAMGPSALAVGNHEFDHGPAAVQARRAEATFPWLAANIRVVNPTATPIAPFAPHVILTTDLGQRIAVFGLIETPPSTRRQNVVGLEFLDPVVTARVMAAQLRPQADLVVALTHVGVDVDREIARAAGDLDLIVGGHSHTVLRSPLRERGVPIVQAGSSNAFLGQVDVTRDMLAGQTAVTARLLETRSLRGEDAAVRAVVDRWNAQMAAALDRHLGQTAVALDRDPRFRQDTNIGNLIADAMRAAFDRADAAMTNNGGIRASIPAGPITLRSLYSVLPFANYFMLFEVTGEQLREVVLTSYARRNQVDLQVSGLTIRYLVDATGRLLDAEISVGGQPLQPGRRYRVVVNDFMGTGGSGYRFHAYGTPADVSSRTDVLDVAAFIEKGLRGVVAYPPTEGRIRVEVRR